MTNVDAQTQLGDADNTADGLPDRLMERKPSYVRAMTELQVAAMSRRGTRMVQDISPELLAEEVLISPSLSAGGRTRFTLTNSHWTPIYAALMRWDEACDNDCGRGEELIGWFELAPAETQTFSNPSGAGHIFYYAEATDGSVYDGSSIHALVMDVQFQICRCNQGHIPPGHTPWYEVGFDELDLSEWSGVTFF
jgi:hypothetical protein